MCLEWMGYKMSIKLLKNISFVFEANSSMKLDFTVILTFFALASWGAPAIGQSVSDWQIVERRSVDGYFEVIGVASNDVLNIRAEPSGSSAKLGFLEHDDKVVEITALNRTGRWGNVRAGERMGWVSMKFLRPATLTTYGNTKIPIGLECFVTEPFDRYTFGAGHIKFSSQNGGTEILPIENIISNDVNYTTFYERMGLTSEMTISRKLGSDGMSDLNFPWSFSAQEYPFGGVCSYN